MNANPEHKEQARRLYFQSDLSQAQISAIIGINPRTLFDWIKEGQWKSARKAAATAPVLIAEQCYTQLSAIGDAIADRADRHYPTLEEADIMRKLTTTINQVKLRFSVSEAVEMFTLFTTFLNQHDHELTKKVLPFITRYIHSLGTGSKKMATQFQEEENTIREYNEYMQGQSALNNTPGHNLAA